MGSLKGDEQELYEAVFAARESALAALTPGAAGSAVDEAARSALQQRGFGPNFKHSTGHGVGFQCINPDARPRLHPKSEDRLAIACLEGMRAVSGSFRTPSPWLRVIRKTPSARWRSTKWRDRFSKSA